MLRVRQVVEEVVEFLRVHLAHSFERMQHDANCFVARGCSVVCLDLRAREELAFFMAFSLLADLPAMQSAANESECTAKDGPPPAPR